jgi:peptidyl-prolyl cis-trans isomerase SurA
MTGYRLIAIATMLSGGLLQGATTIDQIAAIVGQRAIKTSDIARDLRVTQFLNGTAADASIGQKREALQRLIDQELIRNQLAQAVNTSSLSAEATATLAQLRADRFKNSDALLTEELHRRGLTQNQVLDYLQWQLVVLQMIDQRFRPGVSIDDDQVTAYYDQHAADLKRQYPDNPTREALLSRARELLEGERINRDFEDWIEQARKNIRIEYKVDELK